MFSEQTKALNEVGNNIKGGLPKGGLCIPAEEGPLGQGTGSVSESNSEPVVENPVRVAN